MCWCLLSIRVRQATQEGSQKISLCSVRNLDISKVEHSDNCRRVHPERTTHTQQDHTQPHSSRAAGSARSASVSAAASAAHHSAVACCQAQRAECSARELSARAAADSAVPQRVEGTQGCAGRRCSSQRVCSWGSRRAIAAACCHELYARRARRARAARNCEQPLHRVAQDQGGHRREVSLTSRHRWRGRLQQAALLDRCRPHLDRFRRGRAAWASSPPHAKEPGLAGPCSAHLASPRAEATQGDHELRRCARGAARARAQQRYARARARVNGV